MSRYKTIDEFLNNIPNTFERFETCRVTPSKEQFGFPVLGNRARAMPPTTPGTTTLIPAKDYSSQTHTIRHPHPQLHPSPRPYPHTHATRHPHPRPQLRPLPLPHPHTHPRPQLPPQRPQEAQSQMTRTAMKNANTNDPNVWGPSMWFSLHNGASTYPKNASPIVRERMKGLILGLPYILSCYDCKIHAGSYIEEIKPKLDEICSNRESLFRFFVDFHNYVNKRLGKPIVSYKEAWSIYNNGIDVIVTTYKKKT